MRESITVKKGKKGTSNVRERNMLEKKTQRGDKGVRCECERHILCLFASASSDPEGMCLNKFESIGFKLIFYAKLEIMWKCAMFGLSRNYHA